MSDESSKTLSLAIQREYLPRCLSWLLRLGQDRPAVAQFTESPWELSRTVQLMLSARSLPETGDSQVELINKKLLQSTGGYVSIIRWLLDTQEAHGSWDGGRRYDSAMVLWSLADVYAHFSQDDFRKFGIVDLLPKIQKGLQWIQSEYGDEAKLISSSIDGNSVFLSLIAFLYSSNLDECLSAFGDNKVLNELVIRVLDKVLSYVETRFQQNEQGRDKLAAYNMLDQHEVPIGLSDILFAHKGKIWGALEIFVPRIEKVLLQYMELTESVLVSHSWLSFTNRARLLTAYSTAKSAVGRVSSLV